MTNQNNTAQPVLTDDEIKAIRDRLGGGFLGPVPFARAIESALLSALRAPVAGEAQEPIGFVDPVYVAGRQRGMKWNAKIYDAPTQEATAPLYAAPQASSAPVAFSKDGVLFWYGDHAARRGFNGDLYLAPLASEAVRQQRAEVVDELARLREALQFYAHGNHYHFFSDTWDTCSGEPQNFWFDEAETGMIEDGSVARAALSAQSVLSSGAPNGRKRTAAERRAPMVERVYGTGVTAQPAQKEQSE